MANPLVGFHAGVTGNRNGIGDYFKELDDAGIPFCIKSIADVGLVVEAADYAIASGVPHNIILRFPNPGGGGETPDYYFHPLSSAEDWYAGFLATIVHAPEFERVKEYVWIEIMNEMRTEVDPDDPMYNNMHPADWLGWFAYYLGAKMNADGYKMVAFGMNGGTPEPQDWFLPGMVQYLRSCEEHPDMLAVGLHEYNWGITDDPDSLHPHLLGRYEWLFERCDLLGIARPIVFITEYGWAYNDMPDENMAMDHIRWYANKIKDFPTIRGAFMWTLEGTTDLPNKLNALIGSVTEYTKNTEFGDPPPPDDDPELPAFIKHTIHLLPQDTTPDELAAVTKYLHPTRSAFTYSADVVHAVMDAGTDESKAVVWDGHRWPDDIFEWLSVRGISYQKGSLSKIVPGDTPPPPPPPPPPIGNGNALIGLNASADPGDARPGDFYEFENLLAGRPGLIKVLNAHSENYISLLALSNPGCKWVVRAFLNFGGRAITPRQFFDDTVNDTRRALNALADVNVPISNIDVELHNEPNIPLEGYGTAWNSAWQFNAWYLSVLGLYRAEFPHHQFMFPGLSPGPTVPGQRINHIEFLESCQPAVNASNSLGIHAYWNPPDFPMVTALNVIDETMAMFPNMHVFITEASNNNRTSQRPTPEQIAEQYVQFWLQMRMRVMVDGIAFFVVSASDQFFGPETWVDKELGRLVREEMIRRAG